MQLTIRDIYERAGGGVTTDSRGDVAGKLFVPLKGPNFDGHDYIEAALAKGAAWALTERGNESGAEEAGAGESAAKGDGADEGGAKGPKAGEGDAKRRDASCRLIKVESTLQTLQDLAEYSRSLFNGPVVAITGSAGKTTTKDMIASVLSQKYKTLKTPGNLNNDIGLPLTLLSRSEDHQAMVLEMGMNHLGEISVLSKIGKPDICIITNIGDAHIENLGSREGILQAKSEIFEGMRQGGTVILNGDDPMLSALPKVPHSGKTIYCCLKDSDTPEGSRISAVKVNRRGLSGTSCSISWMIDGLPKNLDYNLSESSMTIEIPLPGDHMVMNALMSFAVGLEAGLSPQQIAAGIKDFTPSGRRMAITDVNGMVIINDSYNASPSSMKAAIDMMADSLKKGEGRKVCILGDMFELGEFAPEMHREIGRYAVEKIDLLIAIGPISKYMYEAFAEEIAEPGSETTSGKAKKCAVHFQNKSDFINGWQNYLKPGDTVLIKASRGMALESIIEFIAEPQANGLM